MCKKMLLMLVVLGCLVAVTSADAALVSWWQQGRADSPVGSEQWSPTGPLQTGSMWYRQVDSVNAYESRSGNNNVYAVAYDGPSHAGAVLPASPWASEIGTYGARSTVTLEDAEHATGTKAAHNFSGAYSLFVRMKMVDSAATGYLVSNKNYNSSAGNSALRINGFNYMMYYVTDSTGSTERFDIAPGKAVGEWFDLAIVYGSSGGISAFVDGIAVSPAYASGSTDGTLRATTNPWVIGAHADNWYKAEHVVVESVAFFDSALSSQEVSALTVPEPATVLLLSLGGLVLSRRKKSK